jgi:hypothetical protein
MKSKMIVIFGIILLALSLAGMAFSVFTSTAYINATVNTGTVSAEWLTDSSDNLVMHWLYVSSPSISGSGYLGPNYRYVATITGGNFYPNATVVFGLALKNTGTLPWKLKSMWIDITSDSGNLRSELYFGIPGNNGGQDTWATPANSYPINPYSAIYDKKTLDAWNGYTHDFSAAGFPAIQPGHWVPCYGCLEMDINAGNDFQGKTIQFMITVTVEQAP